MSVAPVSHRPAGKRLVLTGTVFSGPLLRAALVAIAGLAATARAEATVFWTDDNPMVMQPFEPEAPAPQPRQRHRKPGHVGPRPDRQVKDDARPVGPLVIAISIEQQTLRVFDANGLFAEAPVSTGMRGHSTPMGVFSIIQKNKYHRSNIYSGAPMPFMQRITWSGIALHAGVLPGYPASHGCIRMPMAFATRLWGWTRMGARVIIAPGEISPAEFAHPLLATHKPAPQPAPAIAAKDLGLKPSTAERTKTQTADAGNAIAPSATGTPVMSDASSAMADAPVPKGDGRIMTRRDLDAEIARTVELPAPAAKADAAQPTAAPATATSAEPKTSESVVADAPPKRTGPIAVLISGKDSKLYARQNFAPLFEAPITIKPGDQPLGTHVFTARADKDDDKTFHWTAVSLPAVPHRADDDENAARRRKSAVEVKPRPQPGSAAEALDRVTIPADVMREITGALATGSSIVVSDQGIAAGGETGQGTEFVVPLR